MNNNNIKKKFYAISCQNNNKELTLDKINNFCYVYKCDSKFSTNYQQKNYLELIAKYLFYIK